MEARVFTAEKMEMLPWNGLKAEIWQSPGEFSFLKEIRDPLNMQNVGAMIVTFHAKRFGNILTAYNLPELIIYNNGTLIYTSCSDCKVEEIEKTEGAAN